MERGGEPLRDRHRPGRHARAWSPTRRGAVVKALAYDSFGVPLSDIAPGFFLPFGFAGGLADPVTGLVRFGLRDYEPGDRALDGARPDPVRGRPGQPVPLRRRRPGRPARPDRPAVRRRLGLRRLRRRRAAVHHRRGRVAVRRGRLRLRHRRRRRAGRPRGERARRSIAEATAKLGPLGRRGRAPSWTRSGCLSGDADDQDAARRHLAGRLQAAGPRRRRRGRRRATSCSRAAGRRCRPRSPPRPAAS